MCGNSARNQRVAGRLLVPVNFHQPLPTPVNLSGNSRGSPATMSSLASLLVVEEVKEWANNTDLRTKARVLWIVDTIKSAVVLTDDDKGTLKVRLSSHTAFISD